MKRHFFGEFLVKFLFAELRAQTVEEFHGHLPIGLSPQLSVFSHQLIPAPFRLTTGD
jgi:hypothetical protein